MDQNRSRMILFVSIVLFVIAMLALAIILGNADYYTQQRTRVIVVPETAPAQQP